MKISSYNEWDPLREVIVGSAEPMVAGIEFHGPRPPDESLWQRAVAIARTAHPRWYVDEVAEDVEDLCKILHEFGVTIHRPSPYGAERLFSTPSWHASGKDVYNVRDLHLIVGDTVVVSASPTRCRLFEPDAFHDIWYRYFEEGFRWIHAPRPRLRGDYLIPYEVSVPATRREDALHTQLSGGRTQTYHRLLEDEILFDAAGTIRIGKDLIYLVSSTGNYRGARWLQSVLGEEYTVHTTTAYRASHIDSTILPLRPGLVLLNSARVNPDNAPECLASWDKLYFEDVAPLPEAELVFQRDVRDRAHAQLGELGVESDLNQISSPWAGLNVLSIDPATVLVHDRQESLLRALEKQGLNAIPVRMRHCYTMLGGLHCSTLDTVRDGTLESYR